MAEHPEPLEESVSAYMGDKRDPGEVSEEVVELVRSDRFIPAIKRDRELTGSSLARSKWRCEIVRAAFEEGGDLLYRQAIVDRWLEWVRVHPPSYTPWSGDHKKRLRELQTFWESNRGSYRALRAYLLENAVASSSDAVRCYPDWVPERTRWALDDLAEHPSGSSSGA